MVRVLSGSTGGPRTQRLRLALPTVRPYPSLMCALCVDHAGGARAWSRYDAGGSRLMLGWEPATPATSNSLRASAPK